MSQKQGSNYQKKTQKPGQQYSKSGNQPSGQAEGQPQKQNKAKPQPAENKDQEEDIWSTMFQKKDSKQANDNEKSYEQEKMNHGIDDDAILCIEETSSESQAQAASRPPKFMNRGKQTRDMQAQEDGGRATKTTSANDFGGQKNSNSLYASAQGSNNKQSNNKGGNPNRERELTKASDAWLQKDSSNSRALNDLEFDEGGHYDQFANKQSTYSENLYTSSAPDISKFSRAQLQQAERVSREIGMEDSGKNIHMAQERGQILERDNEDEELQFSGVIRQNQKGSKAQSNSTIERNTNNKTVHGKNDRQMKQKEQDKNIDKDKPASNLKKKKFTCIQRNIDLTTTFSMLLDKKMNEIVLNRLRGSDQGKGIVRQVQWLSSSQPVVATDSSILAQQLLNPPTGAISSETQIVAIDCERVGIDKWPHEGLARVSIVNYHGVVLMDNFVMPPEGAYVTDYRTKISGVSPESLMKENGAITFVESKEIAFRILKDKIIIGHSVFHDFQALEIQSLILQENIRDLIDFPKIQNPTVYNQKKISLKNLSLEHLQITIQDGAHSSVEDARASLALYRIIEKDWELYAKNQKNLYSKYGKDPTQNNGGYNKSKTSYYPGEREQQNYQGGAGYKKPYYNNQNQNGYQGNQNNYDQRIPINEMASTQTYVPKQQYGQYQQQASQPFTPQKMQQMNLNQQKSFVPSDMQQQQPPQATYNTSAKPFQFSGLEQDGSVQGNTFTGNIMPQIPISMSQPMPQLQAQLNMSTATKEFRPQQSGQWQQPSYQGAQPHLSQPMPQQQMQMQPAPVMQTQVKSFIPTSKTIPSFQPTNQQYQKLNTFTPQSSMPMQAASFIPSNQNQQFDQNTAPSWQQFNPNSQASFKPGQNSFYPNQGGIQQNQYQVQQNIQSQQLPPSGGQINARLSLGANQFKPQGN